jgi:glutamate-5-semialdehyde dehydrogenase
MPNDLNANDDLRAAIAAMGASARAASRALARSTTGERNRALEAAAEELVDREKAILAANAKDVKAARSEGNDDAFIDRLALTAKAIDAMAEGVREIAKLPDPVAKSPTCAIGPPASRSEACACRSA